MFAPDTTEIDEFFHQHSPLSPYKALASVCDTNGDVVWEHLVKSTIQIFRDSRLNDGIDTSDATPISLLNGVITHFFNGERETGTSVERRRLRGNHRTEQTKPRLFIREYVWFVIGYTRHALRTPPRPPLSERQSWFSENVTKLLLPHRWWEYITTTTDEEEYKRNQLAIAYCSDLIEPIVNPSGGLWDINTTRSICVAERVFSSYRFCHEMIPISTLHPRNGHPVHPHAAGKFVEPRYANDPSKRRAIRDRIDEYVRNSQHAMLGRCVAELATSRHVLFGEYATFERESPRDARVFKARSTLKRCMYSEQYRDGILAMATKAESDALDSPAFAKWRDTIDLCVYAMIFTGIVPPVTVETKGSGRTGVTQYRDAFCSEYVISWYDWLSSRHMIRMLLTQRDDRRALPMILDIGSGFLVRDGPAHSEVTMLVSGTGVCPPPDPRYLSYETEWVYLPTAMDALIEWEYRACKYHNGDLERAVPIPNIARCDAIIPIGDAMANQPLQFADEPDFIEAEEQGEEDE